jgi:hypothetical protein
LSIEILRLRWRFAQDDNQLLYKPALVGEIMEGKARKGKGF